MPSEEIKTEESRVYSGVLEIEWEGAHLKSITVGDFVIANYMFSELEDFIGENIIMQIKKNPIILQGRDLNVRKVVV